MDSEKKIVVRDALIYAVKLWLDGLKDVGLAFLGLGAAAIDVLAGKSANGYRFYKVMRLGKRVDGILDVYGHEDPHDEIRSKTGSIR